MLWGETVPVQVLGQALEHAARLRKCAPRFFDRGVWPIPGIASLHGPLGELRQVSLASRQLRGSSLANRIQRRTSASRSGLLIEDFPFAQRWPQQAPSQTSAAGDLVWRRYDDILADREIPEDASDLHSYATLVGHMR